MSSPSPRRFWLTPHAVGWFCGMAVAFAVMYFALPKQAVDDPRGLSTTPDGQSAANNSLCETKLLKWIQSVDPARLQFNTDIESRILELNRFWTTCGPKGDDPIVSDLKPIEAAISGENRERVLSPHFGRRDIEHIRQSLLISRIATRIAESNQSDLERAVAALAVVSQLTEPNLDPFAADRPLTPFECLMLGQATPADRVWVYTEVVRQLHLDAVVLTSDDPAVSPLVGVVVEEEVYLFEPLLGLPVPAAGESRRTTIYQEPAKLRDALADDSILRQLDLPGAPFPWTAERLKSAGAKLVGTSGTWSPRMAELQFQWPTSQMCVIYDGLGASTGTERGLVERVNAALLPLGYSADQMIVWDYPEKRCELYDTLGAEAAKHMAPLIAVMEGPTLFEEVEDPQTRVWSVTLQRSKRSLQAARMQQLLGHSTQAIEGYLPLMRVHLTVPQNTQVITGPVQLAMDLNRAVADKATYWMAATQFENQNVKACADTLKRYARDFPLGEMREAATMRQAACLASDQAYSQAAELLMDIGPGPNLTRRMLLAKRMLELQVSKGEKPSEKPVEPVPPQPVETPPATAPLTPSEVIPPAPPQAEALPK